MNAELKSLTEAAPQPAEPLAQQLTQVMRAELAQFSGGLAPDDYARAWWDLWGSLASLPEQQLALARSAALKGIDTWQFALLAALGRQNDHGNPGKQFSDPAWEKFPFNVYARVFGHLSGWSTEFITRAKGLTPANAKRLEFVQRQLLNVVSPTHYLLTNPELLQLTRDEGGQNLLRGAQHWIEDLQHALGGVRMRTDAYPVGEKVAITQGQVVMQNELMELIQYSPQTEDVYAEPILIVPAWIMKYYILDLSPANSMVRYLVEQGHTVFMVSWKNPTAADRNLAMDDYLRLGLRAAIDAVSQIVPQQPLHAVGYCIGGTLLAIGAADFARDGDTRLASLTLLAAQTDFSEPGELSLFITPSQLAMLRSIMEQQGVLSSERMGAAFALLRPGDLLWNPLVNSYLRGKRDLMNDLMAWNADGTRMPCRMHSQYLDELYLQNRLALGGFTVAGKPVHLEDLTLPMFVVGTETDHVAPWKSVYKTRALTRSADYTFLLTSGGHNAGIISGPVNARRRHRVYHWSDAHAALDAAQYQELATRQQGSWWPTWERWLAAHSGAARKVPPATGNAAAGLTSLRDAPGEYVHG
ncbi:MAG TPA: alpha/beta fold hydrolase [Steroidobacteraceae bacterium]|nr:alpha/beta fold hydrolase [Steroidobacteraceae bacterium]